MGTGDCRFSVRRQLRHCSRNEVLQVRFALSQSEATQLGESPELPFAGLVRPGRREVRVSTLKAEEKRELARANQSEISSFMKHAAAQAATRSGVHPTALTRMRLVITRKSDSKLKARLIVL